ncbi:MAG TPA: hypothetical protein VG675_09520 [Bryobacteraceae bacterium]|nr:hypothetical protein [Bryobacteraceae bacterium]
MVASVFPQAAFYAVSGLNPRGNGIGKHLLIRTSATITRTPGTSADSL